jgi:hypothetical protein
MHTVHPAIQQPQQFAPHAVPCPKHIPATPCPALVLQVAQSEEICLELHTKDVPDDTTVGFHVDFVWKSTTFDRMKNSLGTFRDYQASMSGYLFHTILGHNVEQVGRREGGTAAAVGGAVCRPVHLPQCGSAHGGLLIEAGRADMHAYMRSRGRCMQHA